MASSGCDALRVERDGAVRRLHLSRPDRRNAFNDDTVEALIDAAREIDGDESVRVAVLAGDGPVFCAGADIAWMRELGTKPDDENRASAVRMAEMFRALDRLRVPLVTLAHGACIGGGLGLVGASDVVVAAPDCVFAASEVRLGILPAVIGPYLLRRLGEARCREVMLTGRRFSAEEAESWGLVHHLDASVESVVGDLLLGSPAAQAHIKRFLRELARRPDDDALAGWTAGEIAAARAREDGREGLAAFLEKRAASWTPKRDA